MQGIWSAITSAYDRLSQTLRFCAKAWLKVRVSDCCQLLQVYTFQCTDCCSVLCVGCASSVMCGRALECASICASSSASICLHCLQVLLLMSGWTFSCWLLSPVAAVCKVRDNSSDKLTSLSLLQLCLLAMSIPASRMNRRLIAALVGLDVGPPDDGTLPVPGCHITLACGAAQGVLLYSAVHASPLFVGRSLQSLSYRCAYDGSVLVIFRWDQHCFNRSLCYAGLLG